MSYIGYIKDDGLRGFIEIVEYEEIKDGGILVLTKNGEKLSFSKDKFILFDDEKRIPLWTDEKYSIEAMQAENPASTNHIENLVAYHDSQVEDSCDSYEDLYKYEGMEKHVPYFIQYMRRCVNEEDCKKICKAPILFGHEWADENYKDVKPTSAPTIDAEFVVILENNFCAIHSEGVVYILADEFKDWLKNN